MSKNADRSNKKGSRLIFGFSNMEDIGNIDKIRLVKGQERISEGEGVKIGNVDNFFQSYFIKQKSRDIPRKGNRAKKGIFCLFVCF